jgi:hypothetical protein
MSTETPLNARQWLNNWSEPDWAPAPGFDWPAAAKMCEGYARAVLAEAERAHRWIPVGERLPEPGQKFVALSLGDSSETTYYTVFRMGELPKGRMFWNPGGHIGLMCYLTHWKPLDELPTEAADLLAGMRGENC